LNLSLQSYKKSVEMCYFCSTIQAMTTMKHIIEIKGRSRVVVGRLAEVLPEMLPQKRVIVITDSNIDRHYHSFIEQYESIIIGLGETSKTLHTLDLIYRRLIEMGADRSTFLLGIGGGIVTDITGFVASTYMRGVEFGFVSTTLLGQVDASVGGKNGVNMDGYKNMVGTFNQPSFVVCDVDMLRTLPKREFRTGLAEIIKAGIIADATLFEQLERCDFDSLANNHELLGEIVYRAIKVKADIVERDEREMGDRRKLNLGHTMAHAIEKCSSKMNHGEAVAVGLSLIAAAATKCKEMSLTDAERINNLLLRAGFVLDSPVEMRQLLKAARKDKKSEGEHIHIVFPTVIGNCRVATLPIQEFEELIMAQ
jgi:3-dehydroquinate synthase